MVAAPRLRPRPQTGGHREGLDVSAARQSAAAVNGSTLETDVAALLRRYEPAAYWQQNYPKSRGQRVIGKGAPDFLVTWPALGLVALFDAKSTVGDKWSVGSDAEVAGKYRGLAPHQRVALRRMEEAGGVAGVYLRLRSCSDPLDLWVPFRVIDPLWSAWWDDRRERYVTEGMGVRVREGDLLSAIRAAQ